MSWLQDGAERWNELRLASELIIMDEVYGLSELPRRNELLVGSEL